MDGLVDALSDNAPEPVSSETMPDNRSKRLSSNQRLKIKNQRLQTQLTKAEEEIERLSKPQKVVEDPNVDWATSLVDAVNAEPVSEKRESGYARIKRKWEKEKERADYLAKDVASLEGLAERLLNQLERAGRTNMTDQDRDRIIRMVNDIREHLANS
jgi:MoxR-like ATPase